MGRNSLALDSTALYTLPHLPTQHFHCVAALQRCIPPHIPPTIHKLFAHRNLRGHCQTLSRILGGTPSSSSVFIQLNKRLHRTLIASKGGETRTASRHKPNRDPDPRGGSNPRILILLECLLYYLTSHLPSFFRVSANQAGEAESIVPYFVRCFPFVFVP